MSQRPKRKEGQEKSDPVLRLEHGLMLENCYRSISVLLIDENKGPSYANEEEKPLMT